MADRQLPGFLSLLFPLLVVVALLLVVLWVVQFGASGVGAIFGFGAYFLGFHVYLPYRVHRDATRRGRNATVWTAATFFVPLVALAYFLLTRR